jgi:prepilin signal peptidase PulO-like enzyme (type II secretory pathway)
MSFKNLLKRIKKNAAMYFNAALIAALPMFEMLIAALPQLQLYLPDNIYKIVGVCAVVGNIVLQSWAKKEVQHGPT